MLKRTEEKISVLKHRILKRRYETKEMDLVLRGKLGGYKFIANELRLGVKGAELVQELREHIKLQKNLLESGGELEKYARGKIKAYQEMIRKINKIA